MSYSMPYSTFFAALSCSIDTGKRVELAEGGVFVYTRRQRAGGVIGRPILKYGLRGKTSSLTHSLSE